MQDLLGALSGRSLPSSSQPSVNRLPNQSGHFCCQIFGSIMTKQSTHWCFRHSKTSIFLSSISFVLSSICGSFLRTTFFTIPQDCIQKQPLSDKRYAQAEFRLHQKLCKRKPDRITDGTSRQKKIGF